MIGETGMVDNFDVSLSSSFIGKTFLPDEARTERNVEIIYHSCLTNQDMHTHTHMTGGVPAVVVQSEALWARIPEIQV